MGRVKTTFVKTSAKKIHAKGKEEFSEDFDKNKQIVDKYAVVPSKKLKNVIVGYITRIARKSKNEEL